MTSRVQEIVSRRQALIALSALQRARFDLQAKDLQQSLWLADLAGRGVHLLRTRPLLVLGVIAGIAILRPRRLLGSAYRSVLLAVSLAQLGRTLRKVW